MAFLPCFRPLQDNRLNGIVKVHLRHSYSSDRTGTGKFHYQVFEDPAVKILAVKQSNKAYYRFFIFELKECGFIDEIIFRYYPAGIPHLLIKELRHCDTVDELCRFYSASLDYLSDKAKVRTPAFRFNQFLDFGFHDI